MKWKAWTGREYLGAAALAGTLAVLATGAWMLQQGRATATGSAASDAAAFTVPAKGDAGAEDALPPFEPALAAADEDEAAAPAAPPSPAPTKLVVFVTGAVKRPGVYTLRRGDRVYHAVRAAGGFKPNAREDVLNQAAEVRDQDQIIIPTKEAVAKQAGGGDAAVSPRRAPRAGSAAPLAPLPSSGRRSSGGTAPVPIVTLIRAESNSEEGEEKAEEPRVLGTPPVVAAQVGAGDAGAAAEPPAGATGAGAAPKRSSRGSGGGSGGAAAKFKNPGDGMVNLNTAGAGELQKLPGVGPSTAAKILEYRQRIGQFTDVQQLQDVKGIGEKKFAKMRPFLTL